MKDYLFRWLIIAREYNRKYSEISDTKIEGFTPVIGSIIPPPRRR